jgi:hypothetical protein
MSKIDDYLDDIIHHAALFERYKTGQGRKILRHVRATNKQIAGYVLRHSFETKKQYAIGSREVKDYVKEMVSTLHRIIRKDMMALISEESNFVVESSPEELDDNVNEERILNDIMFDTFSDTDTITSYLETLGERLFKAWDAQFRVAYMTGIDSKDIIKAAIG